MATETHPNLTGDLVEFANNYLDSFEIMEWEEENWNDDWSALTQSQVELLDEYFQILDGTMDKIVTPAIYEKLRKDRPDLDDGAADQALLMLRIGLMFTAAKAGEFGPWFEQIMLETYKHNQES